MINLIKTLIGQLKREHYWRFIYSDGVRKHYECDKCGRRDCA